MIGRGVAAAAALVCAGCSLLRPDDRPVPDGVEAFFDMMGEEPAGADPRFACRIETERARLLASADDSFDGPDYQWWEAPTEGGGSADVVTQLTDDGRAVGGSGGGCGNESDPGREDGLWWSGGSGSDQSVVHGGHVPDGAVAARLTFDDNPPVVAEVNDAGFFLVVLGESAAGMEWSFPDLLEAIDAEGNVVAEETP